MSRSGYYEDLDSWASIRWRGAVTSAIRGKRGQAFLREMLKALNALPEKVLISKELEQEGQVCALGAVGKQRGISMGSFDPEDRDTVAAAFGIPFALCCEIVYMNDEYIHILTETPRERYLRMRKWIKGQLARP